MTAANAGEPDPEFCALSQRVDSKRHSWKFDGDDPYVACVFCGEVRDAVSAAIRRASCGEWATPDEPKTAVIPSGAKSVVVDFGLPRTTYPLRYEPP